MHAMMTANRLQSAGLRATPKRLAIGALLFDGKDKHVTADDVAALARKAGLRVSLATVYNTLNQFVAAGLMKRITLDAERTYFDTNISDHHHLYYEQSGDLRDVPAEAIRIQGLPAAPSGTSIRSIDVIVRLAEAPKRR
jgi:Fur family transcriptional regulator, iron response regulator